MKNITVVLPVAMAALAICGVSFSATANASPAARRPAIILTGHHRSHDRTVGVDNSARADHSPTMMTGAQNVAATVSGGQNSGLKAICPRSPCRISQRVTMFPWHVRRLQSLD